MIEERVRELVAEVHAAGDTWTPAQRIDAIGELDATIAMLQTLSNVEAVAYVEQRRVADRAAGRDAVAAGRGAPVEIAMARGVSRATVDYQLAFARQLVEDHPRLLAACLDGQVSQSAAKHIVAACEPLDHDQRCAIDAELTDLACDLTPSEVRKAADRKVAATDPEAAERRAQQARARKAVRAIMHGDATGTLSALLPAEQAVACWQALDHDARGRRSDGDDRPLNALMCDLLVERVTGQTKAENLNLEVGVVIAASSLYGADNQPAKLIGHKGGDHGVLPAGLVRKLAASDSAWARRLVCDPVDGRLLFMDPTRRRFDGTLRKFILYRDATSRRPYSNTPIYEIDHLDPYANGGPTTPGNGHGVSKSDHRLRDLPGWTVEAINGDAANGVTWTTPTGRSYESRPPPILGHGNTRPPRHRQPRLRQPRLRRFTVDLYTHPVPVEYAGTRHAPPPIAN